MYVSSVHCNLLSRGKQTSIKMIDIPSTSVGERRESWRAAATMRRWQYQGAHRGGSLPAGGAQTWKLTSTN